MQLADATGDIQNAAATDFSSVLKQAGLPKAL
jgi:hypothetical protein